MIAFFSLENSRDAAEIERPQRSRLEIDPADLGLTEEEVFELSDRLESTLSKEQGEKLELRQRRRAEAIKRYEEEQAKRLQEMKERVRFEDNFWSRPIGY